MMLLPDFSKRLHASVLDELWSQWSALGVAAGGGSLPSELILDPEALLAATFVFGRRDPRLFDEVLDWLLINGDLIGVSRLRRMLEWDSHAELTKTFEAVSAYLTTKNGLKYRWVSARPKGSAIEPEVEVAFFRDESGERLPTPRKPDPVFRNMGFLREQIAPRELSRPFPTSGNASLMLQLRAFLGMTSRCELLCLLATRSSLSGSEAARLAGYGTRTIQQAFSEMGRTRFLNAERVGKEIQYSLRPGTLQGLLTGSPRFPHAEPLVVALASIAFITDQLLDSPGKSAAIVALARNELGHVSRRLSRSGYNGALAETMHSASEVFFETLWNDCEFLLGCWRGREHHTPATRNDFVRL